MSPMPELVGATERFLIASDTAATLTLRDMVLVAASAASAAATDLVEVLRGETPIAENLRHRETAETLADALRSVLAIHYGADMPEGAEARTRREDGDRLLAALQEYLEGWVL